MKVINHSLSHGSFGVFNLQETHLPRVKRIRVYSSHSSTQFSRERGLGLINEELHELTPRGLTPISIR